MNYLDLLSLTAPETIIVIAALVVLGVDLLVLSGMEATIRSLITAMISVMACVAAIAWLLVFPREVNLMDGTFVMNPLVGLAKVGLLALTIFTAILSVQSRFTKHDGEYFAVLLLATAGLMFLISTEDILVIFVALELSSLSLYILTAFDKANPRSAEAALKYFLFGGLCAAMTLFGLSLLYGLSGSTGLGRIAAAVNSPRLDPLLLVAMVLTATGFGFKVAAAPFHLWAPDVYQAAPLPAAAFIASASKLASFFVFAKVMMLGFAGAEGSAGVRDFLPGWLPVIGLIAAVSMILGNLAAIVQRSVRRLLAYSAIAHAGYVLLAIMAADSQGISALLYYTITYGLTVLGAFAVVQVVQERAGGDDIAAFAGFSRRAPWLSFCMLVFLLSLAGIPPLAGFFGKFYVFAAGLRSGGANLRLLWLVILAIGMSAVSLYYYLQVLKQIYVAAPPSDAGRIQVPALQQWTVGALAAGVILFGIAPNLLVSPLAAATSGQTRQASAQHSLRSPGVPVIYCTDLFHPHDDPDDHFDLATLFAMTELDIQGIVLDQGERQQQRPGRIPVSQLNHITARNIPSVIGLANKLKSPADPALDQPSQFQGGVNLILDVLRKSELPVKLAAVGSVRDVVAAYNREPALFRSKVSAVLVFIGEASNPELKEYNVDLDPNAYVGLMRSGLPVYWVPCFDGGPWQNHGHASFWKAKHSDLLGSASPSLTQYFIYALQKEQADPVSFLSATVNPARRSALLSGERNLWCTAIFGVMSGRRIYYDGTTWISRPADYRPDPRSHWSEVKLFDFPEVELRISDDARVQYGPGPDAHKVHRFEVLNPSDYSRAMTMVTAELLRALGTSEIR